MLRHLLPAATLVLLGSAMTFGCTGTQGFGDGANIGVGGGGSESASGTGSGNGSGTGSGNGSGTGSGTGGASGATSGVTSGNGTSGTGPAPATFSMSLAEDSLGLDLDDSGDLTVEITATGDVGTVTLSAIDLPSGVSADFSPSQLTFGASGTKTATLTLTSLSSASVGDDAFTVIASSADDDHTADATVTVDPVITIVIPNGVNNLGGSNGNPYKTAYGPYPIEITAPPPVTVYIYNDDGTAHEVHSDDGDIGFPHDDGPIAPNSMDQKVRQLQVQGTYNFYLHDQAGPATPGRIVIQ